MLKPLADLISFILGKIYWLFPKEPYRECGVIVPGRMMVKRGRIPEFIVGLMMMSETLAFWLVICLAIALATWVGFHLNINISIRWGS